ncbi:hypothetical protein LZ30DRAFT_594248, partial [Colletotrichum cereale]
SVVYAFPDKKELFVCNSNVASIITATRQGLSQLGTTVICFCPTFFGSSRNSKSQMKSQWRRKANTRMSRSMILLHEIQHMATATTNSEHCADYAYTPERDASKIQNVQNYVFFALDVLVNPEKAAP